MYANHIRSYALSAFVAVSGLSMLGCTTSQIGDRASATSKHAAVDAQIDAELSKLYNTVPGARDMVAASKGMLVFPAVVGGSFVVGGEFGHGALRIKGRTQKYYNIAAGSIGWQAGAQSKGIFYLFTTQEALDKFLASNGWIAGVDATVAIANVGANGSIDTNTMRAPVVGFVLANAGLEIGASVQGMKISENRL
ncbi:YSC84-related protein [Acidovorax sp. A1169]|uniref:BPSL1445 family SYLF domain-containing lipoprotein n=1 Tax=Acidovorax sp. A1169 TaxID=3059524 RepID=UPI002737C188|nr:YSC84-related protein [Acidovorax sp. A1169]MDP4076354.1 YSC84-related protein [Acidovorax sp. A1169]